jgi:hypothetical protein
VAHRAAVRAASRALMFNPLTPSEMVAAIGLAARSAARADGELDDFDRGQLMSAYSATRHLAIEIASFDAELAARCAAIADVAAGEPSLGDAAERVRAASDAASAGEAVAELLERCRAEPELSAVGAAIRRELRALCDAEVGLLADGIEAGRP